MRGLQRAGSRACEAIQGKGVKLVVQSPTSPTSAALDLKEIFSADFGR
jgi:hypothetical protein